MGRPCWNGLGVAPRLVDPEPGCLQISVVGSGSEIVHWCVPEEKVMVFQCGVMHQVARSDLLSPPLSALGMSELPGLGYH